jgi:hypothetical protein
LGFAQKNSRYFDLGTINREYLSAQQTGSSSRHTRPNLKVAFGTTDREYLSAQKKQHAPLCVVNREAPELALGTTRQLSE